MTAKKYKYDNVSYRDTGSGLTPAVQRLGVGSLMLFTGENRLIRPTADTVQITENPVYAKTRERNTSGIWFGDLTASIDGDSVVTRPVAVKPLGPAWKAVEEVRIAHDINSIGTSGFSDMAASPVTFQPIGIASNAGKYSVVTGFEGAVTSFDNVLQRETGERAHDRQVEAALAYAAASLIFLHANKFNHLDYQIKNTASDGTSSRVIDVTSVKKRKTIDTSNVEGFLHDIEVYANSVAKNYQFNGVGKDLMHDTFIDYYLSCVSDIFPQELQGRVRKRIETIVNNAYRSRSAA